MCKQQQTNLSHFLPNVRAYPANTRHLPNVILLLCRRVNTRHLPNVILLLCRRRRRRANISTTLGQCLVFAGYSQTLTMKYKRWSHLSLLDMKYCALLQRRDMLEADDLICHLALMNLQTAQ